MKKILLFLFVCLLLATQSASQVFAHMLESDGSIGAVLHIDPNDDPIAGQQSTFFFDFKDKENRFQPKDCNCTFSVSENGKTIYSQPLFQTNSNPNLSSASIFYTFPQRDIYQVEVTGKPLTPNAFQPFTLIWNWRVDQITSNQTTGQKNDNFFLTHIPHFFLLGVILLVFLAFGIYQVVKSISKKKPQEKGGEKQHDKEDHSNIY